MIAKSRLVRIPLLARAKAALLAITPILAHAADNVMAQLALRGSLEDLSALTWFFLAFFSLLGWIVADLDKLAELWDTDGKTMAEKVRERLKLCKGVAGSLVAGMSIYFLGRHAPGVFLGAIGLQGEVYLPEMVLFVFVTMGGYMGTRFWAWFERKYFGGS